MAIIMGLLIVPTCRSFLNVARLSVHCMDGWVIHEFLIIVHGRPHYRPWETLSFMNHILVQEHFLVSLGGS